MAAIAVPREFDAFGTHQDVDAGAVERRPKRIRVQRLAPLVVSLFVTMLAVFGLGERGRRNKFVAYGGGIPGKRKVVFTKMKIVGLPRRVGVILPGGSFGRLRMAGVVERPGEQSYAHKTDGANEDSPCLRHHRDLPT